MRHREIQHASYERQYSIRHDRRVVGDGVDQRVHVASGHVGDEPVAPVRKEFAGDDPLVFRPALLVGLGVAREILVGQVRNRRPVACLEAVCRRVRAVKRHLGEDLPCPRAAPRTVPSRPSLVGPSRRPERLPHRLLELVEGQ